MNCNITITFFVSQTGIKRPDGKIGCGASLLTPNGAVTAGHCLENCQSIIAYFGSKKKYEGLSRPIKSWQIHPEYGTVTNLYDIAVFVWKEPISWNKEISPISIGTHPKVGTVATVAGFGKINDKENFLRSVKVTITDHVTCKKNTVGWNRFFELVPPDSYICSNDKPYKGTCNGDNGGPLFLDKSQPILIGVASIGAVSCSELSTHLLNFTRNGYKILYNASSKIQQKMSKRNVYNK